MGEYVEPGMILASSPTEEPSPDGGSEQLAEPPEQVIANIGGRVELGPDGVSIFWEDVEEREHVIPAPAYLLVRDGDQVKAGDALIGGPLNPHDILNISGKDDLQRYLVNEVQQVYQSQGVSTQSPNLSLIHISEPTRPY